MKSDNMGLRAYAQKAGELLGFEDAELYLEYIITPYDCIISSMSNVKLFSQEALEAFENEDPGFIEQEENPYSSTNGGLLEGLAQELERALKIDVNPTFKYCDSSSLDMGLLLNRAIHGVNDVPDVRGAMNLPKDHLALSFKALYMCKAKLAELRYVSPLVYLGSGYAQIMKMDVNSTDPGDDKTLGLNFSTKESFVEYVSLEVANKWYETAKSWGFKPKYFAGQPENLRNGSSTN
jgi:hypothetical protein